MGMAGFVTGLFRNFVRMKPLIETPPRSIMEVYKNLPEGTLAELINNVLYMSPSLATDHQETLKKIFRALDSQIEKEGRGIVLFAPYDVYFDETGNAVQPDIIVIMKDNPGSVEARGHFHGSPDLIIEILSPGNKDHDLITKKDLYEKFGVGEYWIVDSETRLSVGYKLENGRYRKIDDRIGEIKSPLVGGPIKF